MGLTINEPIKSPNGVSVPTGSYLRANFANIFRSDRLAPNPLAPFPTKWMMHGGYSVYVNSEPVFEDIVSIQLQDSEITQSVYPYFYNYIKQNIYKNTTDS
jgi:hypothetical protein